MKLRTPKLPAPLEKDVQRAVVKFYRTVGCRVLSTSQARRSKVALGLPDLLVFWPARGAFWFHEVKREGGKLSEDQVDFQNLCRNCSEDFVVGGLAAAAAQVALIRGMP